MSKYWSKGIAELEPYQPGEQPNKQGCIKLNTNENPFPPAPSVYQALQNFDIAQLRRYPQPDAAALRHCIADYHKIESNQVFAGNGSDEVLALSYLAFFRQPSPLLFPDITYSFYAVYSELFDVRYRQLPLAENFEVQVEDYKTYNGGIIIANPNAPTGLLLSLSKIEQLVNENAQSVVLIDEAYIDYGGESALSLIDRYPNLLVVRTLSKSRALAGLRVGYALGDAALIEGLDRVKNSFNCYPLDSLAIAAAIASFNDEEYFRDTLARTVKTREKLIQGLRDLAFYVVESHANFVFTSHAKISAEELSHYLKQHDILVRHFKRARIDNFLRISVGTDAEIDRLLEAIGERLAQAE